MSTNEKDFLSDRKFVLWMLTGDVELQKYWEKALDENPAMRNDFDKAVARFGGLRLKGGALSDDEFAGLRLRIGRSVARSGRRRKIARLACWAAAACIAAVAITHIYIGKNAAREDVAFMEEHLIVGENADEKEIRLITDAGATRFAGDVHVRVGADGKTTIQEIDGGRQTVVEPAATMNRLVVPYGKRSELALSDGTRVWINSGSALEFPAVFDEKKPRIVNLSGEIYIEVAPDASRPFYVNTPAFQVKVHGTKFNISAYHDSDAASVVLVDGKVGVRNLQGAEMVLTPNDKLTCGAAEWEKRPVDVLEYISWKDGYMLLNRSPILSVLKRMERYYNLSFNIRDSVRLETVTCTGKLYLSENPDEVMSAVSFLSSTKYSRQDGVICIE